MNILFGFGVSAIIFFIAFFLLLFREKPFKVFYYLVRDAFMNIKNNKKKDHKFPLYGFWLYCGLGGSGKTLAMVQRIKELKEQYPKLWVVTNFSTPLSDQKMDSWKDLIEIENPNGVDYGVLFAFDEIHLTLASDNYRNRPTMLLEYISQQRKLRKMIIGSAQVFTRVDKVLREQSNLVIECKTYFKRWNFQNAYLTEDYLLNGELKDKGVRKRTTNWKKNFVASDELFSLYDTYEVMKPLIKENDGECTLALK